MPYECRGECGARPGTTTCLAHLLRKLIEESAEVLEALATDERRIREEWRDVETVFEGIAEYHPWLFYGGEKSESLRR